LKQGAVLDLKFISLDAMMVVVVVVAAAAAIKVVQFAPTYLKCQVTLDFEQQC